MKNLKLFLPLFTFFFLLLNFNAQAQIVLHIPGVNGDCKISGYENWIRVDNVDIGVERAMKESGEKGGTQDINIGVGELQECTISKSMDAASTHLIKFGVNGNSLKSAKIHFLQMGSATGKPTTYFEILMDRVFVKSYNVSFNEGDKAVESFALYYNKIKFWNIGSKGVVGEFGWDNVKNVQWNAPRPR